MHSRADGLITVRGTVDEFTFRNPHGVLVVTAAGEGGAQTYEDSAVFEGVAARCMAWTRRPGEYVYPYDCDPGCGE